jgi:hypothetical protein
MDLNTQGGIVATCLYNDVHLLPRLLSLALSSLAHSPPVSAALSHSQFYELIHYLASSFSVLLTKHTDKMQTSRTLNSLKY